MAGRDHMNENAGAEAKNKTENTEFHKEIPKARMGAKKPPFPPRDKSLSEENHPRPKAKDLLTNPPPHPPGGNPNEDWQLQIKSPERKEIKDSRFYMGAKSQCQGGSSLGNGRAGSSEWRPCGVFSQLAGMEPTSLTRSNFLDRHY